MDQSELTLVAQSVKNGNYAFAAAATLFFWDWAMSLEQETRHFWKGTRKRSGVGTLLYFTNRLVMVVAIIMHAIVVFRPANRADFEVFCRVTTTSLLFLSAASTASVQVLLGLRTYALWACDPRILWPLLSLTAGGAITELVLLGTHQHGHIFILNPFPSPYSGCLATKNPWGWQRAVPILAFEIIVLILMVIKFIQFGKNGRSTRLSRVLFRDGFIEFTAVSVSTAFSMILELPIIPDKQNVLYLASYQIAPVIAQVCAAHILLNIHDVMGMSASDPHAYSAEHHTGVRVSGAATRDRNRHTSSFQMGPLPSRKLGAVRDVLDFDEDAVVSHSVVTIATSPSDRFHLNFGGTYEHSPSYDSTMVRERHTP